MRLSRAVVLVGLVACVGSEPLATPAPADGGPGAADTGSPTPPGDGSVVDSGDAGATELPAPPPCKLNDPFGEAKPFEPVNSDEDEGSIRFSADGMTAYFSRGDFAGADANIYVAAGPTFTSPVLLAGVNSIYQAASCCQDVFPSVSADELEIYTYGNSQAPGTIYRASRTLVTESFANRQLVPGLESYTLISPFLSADGKSLYLQEVGGAKRLLQARRTTGFQFSAPEEVAPGGRDPIVNKDETELYYYDTAQSSLMRATRTGKTGAFGNAAKVMELTAIGAIPNYLTPDGCRLYFTSGASGAGKQKNNIWYADKPK